MMENAGIDEMGSVGGGCYSYVLSSRLKNSLRPASGGREQNGTIAQELRSEVGNGAEQLRNEAGDRAEQAPNARSSTLSTNGSGKKQAGPIRSSTLPNPSSGVRENRPGSAFPRRDHRGIDTASEIAELFDDSEAPTGLTYAEASAAGLEGLTEDLDAAIKAGSL